MTVQDVSVLQGNWRHRVVRARAVGSAHQSSHSGLRTAGQKAAGHLQAALLRRHAVAASRASCTPGSLHMCRYIGCVRASVHALMCVCVCVALHLVNQTLAAQTSGRSNPSQACGACKSNRQMTHAPEQHVRQIATPCVSRYICKSSMDDVLHCVHA